jgi:MscS family membrane protein
MIIVSFNELSNYGFGVFVYFYIEMMGYVEYEKLKQSVNISILNILKEEGVKLFFINFNSNRLQYEDNFNDKVNGLENINNITEEEREK